MKNFDLNNLSKSNCEADNVLKRCLEMNQNDCKIFFFSFFEGSCLNKYTFSIIAEYS